MNPPRLPDLELLKIIGSGSYGEVWLARTVTGLYRAVKVVGRARFEDERPWLREFAGISRFQKDMGSRPRQLALLHVGEDKDQGLFYYIMELADDLEKGPDFDPATYQPATLKAVCAKNKDMPFDEVLRIGIDLARSLAELHSAGLIHRDVKPSNIVFIQGVPKLADLGLVSSSEHSLTSLGTPGFSPPEGTGTPRSDIFSLGRILYEMAMRRPSSEYPFLPPELASSPDGPRLMELNEILLAACDPNPLKRYPNAEALLTDLLHIQAGGSLIEMARLRDRLRKATIAAKWAALVLCVVGAGFGMKHYQAIRSLAAEEAAGRVRAESEERQARYISNIQLAQLGAQASDYGAARSALLRAVPQANETDLRGAEWWTLWNSLKGDEAERWSAGKEISAMAPNIARDALLCLQLEDTSPAILMHPNKGAPETLGLNIERIGEEGPNGYFIASNWDRHLVDLIPGTSSPYVWPLETGRLHSSNKNFAVTYKSQGDYFILHVWNRVTHQEAGRWTSPTGTPPPGISSTAVSLDGSFLAFAYFIEGETRKRYIVLYSLKEQKVIWEQETPQLLHGATFSPDGTRIAMSGESYLGVYEASTGKLLLRDDAQKDKITALAWSADGQHLAAGTRARVCIWDVANLRREAVLKGAEASITGLAWLNDGSGLLTAERNGTLRRFAWPHTPHASVGRGLATSQKSYLGNLIFDRNNTWVLATLENNSLGLFSRDDWSLKARWPDAILPIAPTGDDGWFALGQQGRLLYCKPDGTSSTRPLKLAIATAINDQDFSPKGALFAVATDTTKGDLVLWDLKNFKETIHSVGESAFRMVRFSPDGTQLAVSNTKQGIRILNLDTGIWGDWIGRKRIQATAIAFSSNRSRIVAGYADGTIQELDLSTGKIRPLQSVHRGSITGLRFLDQGRTLLSTSRDGTMVFWRTENWRQIAAATPGFEQAGEPAAGIYMIQSSPDENYLALLSEDGSVHFMDNSRQP